MEFATGFYTPPLEDFRSPSDTMDVGTGDAAEDDLGVDTIKTVGISTPMGIAAANVPGVAAKMRTGVRVLEIQFPGSGSAQPRAQTPGMYGERGRTALRELGQIQNVTLSTHAAFGAYGLAGQDQRGNFDDSQRKTLVDEVKRAIEFAADVARGGSVVVHTGEFQRPLSEAEWNKEGKWTDKFRMYKEEPEKATLNVVDNRNGQLIHPMNKGQRTARAVWRTAQSGQKYLGLDGEEHVTEEGDTVYVDYQNNQLATDKRVPDYDFENNKIKVEYKEYKDFVEEAKDFTHRAKEFWRKNHNNPNAWKDTMWERFGDVKSEDDILVKPEEAYVMGVLEANAANSRGWAVHYDVGIKGYIKEIEHLKKQLGYYEDLEKETPEEELWKLRKEVHATDRSRSEFSKTERRLPSEMIKDQIKATEAQLIFDREAGMHQRMSEYDNLETQRHTESAGSYALKKSFDSYADLGIYAMEKTNTLEKRGQLKKPLFVAMENIFPEKYGGHPDEFMNLVERSREKMVSKLVNERGYDSEKAKELAQEHIKGHLDTGHLNMWRKYWVHDPNKTPEQNDADFTKWSLEKVEDMAKKKMVGSVHLVDNWGYQDEHLSPGEGNTPVKQMVRLLKKYGYEGNFVVEPGAAASVDNSDFHGVMQTWRLFGRSSFGINASGGQQLRPFSSVSRGYFGYAQPPHFMVGQYVPSEDWRLWSGVNME